MLRLPYAGKSLGVQLWGPLDFSSVANACDLHVNVTYRHNTWQGSAAPVTIPIAAAAFGTLVRGLALENAKARNFSLHDDTGLGGGGWVDCNSCMGEANSHGAFLAGLAAVYRADARQGAGSVFLQPAQRAELAWHMAVGARYLLSLLSATTGEVRHEYCRDFDHPTKDSCRTNYVGYGGPHRAQSHCHFVVPLIHFIPDSLT